MVSKKFLVNSSDCYEGYSNEEECWIGGDYSSLSDLKDIEESSIEWSQSLWDDEVEYFRECLESEIKNFEKRYNTTVLEVVMCGTVGLWNGSPIGGKVIDIKNPLDMGKVDDIDVSIDKDGIFTVCGHHHDGTHHMHYYFLTKNSMKKAGIFNKYEYEGANNFDYEEFEKIYENINPAKLSTKSKYFDYKYYAQAN